MMLKIEAWIRAMLTNIPNIRGRQLSFRILDRLLGPRAILARQHVLIKGSLSSSQDICFVRSSSENTLLDRLVHEIDPGGVFVDCGANAGFYSCLAAQHLNSQGQVLSLEPSIREYDRLVWAKSKNQHQCQWKTFNVAIGENPGTAFIDLSAGHSGMNRITSTTNKDCQEVIVETLTNIIEREIGQHARVNVLKIDVEGYELKVLRGAFELLDSGRVDKIIVEVTDSFLMRFGDSKRALYDYMASFGYIGTVNSDEWQFDELFVCQPDQSNG